MQMQFAVDVEVWCPRSTTKFRLPSAKTPSYCLCILVTEYYAEISVAGYTPVCTLQWFLL
jgi:hypothetical protein